MQIEMGGNCLEKRRDVDAAVSLNTCNPNLKRKGETERIGQKRHLEIHKSFTETLKAKFKRVLNYKLNNAKTYRLKLLPVKL